LVGPRFDLDLEVVGGADHRRIAVTGAILGQHGFIQPQDVDGG
jgi:hypothetical protein